MKFNEIGDMDVRPRTVALLLGSVVVVVALFSAPLLGSKDANVAPAAAAVADAAIETPAAPVASPAYELQVGHWNCDEAYGYFTIEGVVTNLTTKPIDSIVAVGTFYDGAGNFVKSDNGLIEYQPLLPHPVQGHDFQQPGDPPLRRRLQGILGRHFFGEAVSDMA